MTVQVVGILLAILFTALGWLHYRVNRVHDMVDDILDVSSSNHLMILGLVSILIDKEILEPEAIFGKNVPEHFKKKSKPVA